MSVPPDFACSETSATRSHSTDHVRFVRRGPVRIRCGGVGWRGEESGPERPRHESRQNSASCRSRTTSVASIVSVDSRSCAALIATNGSAGKRRVAKLSRTRINRGARSPPAGAAKIVFLAHYNGAWCKRLVDFSSIQCSHRTAENWIAFLKEDKVQRETAPVTSGPSRG